MRVSPRHVCPICGKQLPRPAGAKDAPPPSPFCSPACKLVDLGRWLDGSYRVPGPPVESSLPDEDPGDRE